MPRSVAAIATELARFMPDHLSVPAAPLLGGTAAAMRAGETAGFDLSSLSTIGGASGKWLDFIAIGHGTRRQSGEEDAALRARLRRPHLGVTPANVKAQVDYLLASVGLGECMVIEWFEGPYVDEDAYLDFVPVVGARSWFLVVVPVAGTDPEVGWSFMDRDAFADRDAFLGAIDASPDLAVYAAIVALVNSIKAAGMRWALYIDASEVYL